MIRKLTTSTYISLRRHSLFYVSMKTPNTKLISVTRDKTKKMAAINSIQYYCWLFAKNYTSRYSSLSSLLLHIFYKGVFPEHFKFMACVLNETATSNNTGQHQFPPWNNFYRYSLGIGSQTRMCKYYVQTALHLDDTSWYLKLKFGAGPKLYYVFHLFLLTSVT
jgi:hypothetical protein